MTTTATAPLQSIQHNARAAVTFASLTQQWLTRQEVAGYIDAGYCLDAVECIPTGGSVSGQFGGWAGYTLRQG